MPKLYVWFYRQLLLILVRIFGCVSDRFRSWHIHTQLQVHARTASVQNISSSTCQFRHGDVYDEARFHILRATTIYIHDNSYLLMLCIFCIRIISLLSSCSTPWQHLLRINRLIEIMRDAINMNNSSTYLKNHLWYIILSTKVWSIKFL